MRLSGIIEESIVDGPGIRVVFFFQGCLHGCPGCQNPATHPMGGGREFDVEQLNDVLKRNPHTDGVTISGGDPFYQIKDLRLLVEMIKNNYHLSILVYTGFVFENLLAESKKDKDLDYILRNIDLIIDGPFLLDQKDLSLLYRGSKNQRIIDVKKSFENNDTILADLVGV